MALLDSDLVRARQEAAAAGSFTARRMTITRELDALVRRERELSERVDLGDGETDTFEGAGLEELLLTFAEDDTIAAESLEMVNSLLQRKVHTQVVAAVRQERDRLFASETAIADSVSRYTELSSRWIAQNSQGDPSRGCTLAKIEKDEKEAEQRIARIDETDAAAHVAEEALEHLRAILHDAVDWVPGDSQAKEADVAILRPERVAPADPWFGAAQIALFRARLTLEAVGDLEAANVPPDSLTGFAESCIQGLMLDLAAKDGIDRALNPVHSTLTAVRALRGHLARARGDARHRIADFQTRRAQILQRGAR